MIWTPDNILALMRNRGQTVEQFARSCHVTRDAVQKWLNGSRVPRRQQQAQLNRLAAGWRRTQRER